jgi:hypothetical protein
MSNLNQLLVDQQKNKPKHTAKIRGNKPAGTTDEDEGRRGLLRHQESVDDGDRESVEDEGLRDAV